MDATAWDAQKLTELYAQHAPAASRLAYLLTDDREAAQDISQEAFIRVTGRALFLRKPDAFAAYLRRTVVNLSKNYLRRARTEQTYIGRTRSSPRLDDSSEVDTRDELWRLLRGLPHRQRTAIVLRFYCDLSEQQTADTLQTSLPAVKSLVKRGMEKIRTEMDGTDHARR